MTSLAYQKEIPNLSNLSYNIFKTMENKAPPKATSKESADPSGGSASLFNSNDKVNLPSSSNRLVETLPEWLISISLAVSSLDVSTVNRGQSLRRYMRSVVLKYSGDAS